MANKRDKMENRIQLFICYEAYVISDLMLEMFISQAISSRF